MKKLILLLTLFTMLSCSTNERTTEDVSIRGKWYMEEMTPCGKNSIEFKNNNLFVENHYNSNCTNSVYNGDYLLQDDTVNINGNEKLITGLSELTLILYDVNTEDYNYYTRNE